MLLLKRNSLHQHDKWGLPGGNIEDTGAPAAGHVQKTAPCLATAAPLTPLLLMWPALTGCI